MVPAFPPRPAAPEPRPLAELVGLLGARVRGDVTPVRVTGATHDSAAVRPGDLFAALPGRHVHGARFAAEAAAAGAVAVLTDPAGAELAASGAGPAGALPPGVPALLVDDPRAVLGEAAAWAFGHPTAGLLLLGVTGTNGKTTTSYLLEAGLAAAGHRTGLLGTVEVRLGGRRLPSVRTTPEASDLQALFAVMREGGVTAVAMEVSSHALALGRLGGTRVDVAAFTNLSAEHLDFHGDMESYFAAKASLFAPGRSAAGVVNVDDPWGARLAATATVPVTGCSPAGDPAADWRADDPVADADGSAFTAVGPTGRHRVRLRLPGAFNIANALVALAALVGAGVDPDRAVAGLAGLAGVPGRLERVDAGQPFTALVDYAHTPAAVGALLATLRPLTRGRLIAVLGCGGDRDRAKRPAMGAALAAGADLAVLTTDNPRSEDPAAILAEMARGAPGGVVVPDRATAIRYAVAQARAGDVVVVAGKGHEQGQQLADRVVPFDDREVLRSALLADGAR